MKNEIKELRVKIDGLAQLTKELKPIKTIFIDVNMIPNGFESVEHWLRVAKATQPYTFIENQDKKEITSIEMFPEISKCYDNLLLAKAWLGKMLRELGSENPYSFGYKTKEDIVPTQDVANLIRDIDYLTQYKKITEKKNHIEKVDWLRQEIEKINNEVEMLDSVRDCNYTRNYKIARTNAYNYLCEARFWLGFELQRIRENG